jgi:hypothetical protein
LATYFFPRHKKVRAGSRSDRSVMNWPPESGSASHDYGLRLCRSGSERNNVRIRTNGLRQQKPIRMQKRVQNSYKLLTSSKLSNDGCFYKKCHYSRKVKTDTAAQRYFHVTLDEQITSFVVKRYTKSSNLSSVIRKIRFQSFCRIPFKMTVMNMTKRNNNISTLQH